MYAFFLFMLMDMSSDNAAQEGLWLYGSFYKVEAMDLKLGDPVPYHWLKQEDILNKNDKELLEIGDCKAYYYPVLEKGVYKGRMKVNVRRAKCIEWQNSGGDLLAKIPKGSFHLDIPCISGLRFTARIEGEKMHLKTQFPYRDGYFNHLKMREDQNYTLEELLPELRKEINFKFD